MNLSYWEIKSWLTNVDFTIIGSGIVGLNCALHLKKYHPKANILILEKGILPQGASTKNAGFACFGSISEILDDLQTHSEEEVFQLIDDRIKGLQLLRETLGDKIIDYKPLGGYELFHDNELFESCLSNTNHINKLLHPLFNANIFSLKNNEFNFNKVNPKYIFNSFEGQIDTGKMMQSLLQKVQSKGVKILNNCIVKSFQDNNEFSHVRTSKLEFRTSKLIIATNGFASHFLNEDIKPARAQVLITRPIEGLHIAGTFHLEKGFYYFRNINGRILLGGGRNLDIETEETTQFGNTGIVQDKLESLLKEVILPNKPFEIDHRWSGIMGVGKQKKPIIKQLSDNIFCGVRLGGMGVAIGASVGRKLAQMTLKN